MIVKTVEPSPCLGLSDEVGKSLFVFRLSVNEKWTKKVRPLLSVSNVPNKLYFAFRRSNPPFESNHFCSYNIRSYNIYIVFDLKNVPIINIMFLDLYWNPIHL